MNLTNNLENLHVLEQIVEQAEFAFFIYDIAPKTFRYISPVFDNLFRRDRLDFAHNPEALLEVVHPDDLETLSKAWHQVHQRKNRSLEFRILMPDAQIKWLCLKTYNIVNEDYSYSISGLVEDITVAKDHSFTTLKYSAKKNSTLEILSHDLAGPLGIIKQLAHLVQDSVAVYKDPETNADLTLIQDTCTRSIALIRDLVNQEFLESSNVEMKKERVNLVEKIGIIIDNYRRSERNLVKQFNLASNQNPIFVYLDDLKFMQVINNLISNAIKFTPENGLINLFLKDTGNHVEISIEDNGIGIPANFHATLFDRFTEARRLGLRGEPTVGLGMSIIKKIVEMHQGTITFETEENQGSTFYIRIPKE